MELLITAANAFIWALVLLGGLVAVPVVRGWSKDNRPRRVGVYVVAVLYCVAQTVLFGLIFGSLRSANPDWVHALMLPFFLGLLLPIAMGAVFLVTRRKQNVV